MRNEFSQLVRDLVALLREKEEERALERLRSATLQASLKRHAAAAEAVTTVNLALMEVRQGREQVLAEIRRLPPAERAGVEARLLPWVDRVFHDEMARLTTLKRQLSDPRASERRRP